MDILLGLNATGAGFKNGSSQYFPTHDDEVVDNDDNVEEDFNVDLMDPCLLSRYSWTWERQSSLIICGENGVTTKQILVMMERLWV